MSDFQRWVLCGQKSCEIMTDTPPVELEKVKTWHPSEWRMDQHYLKSILGLVAGFPGMTLEINESAVEPLDFYQIILKQELPDSNNPAEKIMAGRIGYSLGAMTRHHGMVIEEVRNLMRALVLHEVDEWLRYQGERVRDPHAPELQEA